jgi:hypothetical protein
MLCFALFGEILVVLNGQSTIRIEKCSRLGTTRGLFMKGSEGL